MDLRTFIEPQMGATYDTQLAIARASEEAGFSAFFRSDHFLAAGDGQPGPTDSWVTLGAIARETTTIRLGTMVTSATFRFPGPLAISVAQVDQMSGGRVELGLGAGWMEAEHLAYAIPFPPIGERFERLEDQLEIVTGLWATPAGERFTHRGRHHAVVDSPALPKPVQSPRPPIIIGGNGPTRTPRLAAAYADEFNAPFATPDKARALFDNVRRACEAIERDPATMTYSVAATTICGANEAEVERRAAALGIPVDKLRASGIAGTTEEVVDRLGAFAEAGATRAYLQLLDLSDLDHVRLIGAEVIPKIF